MLLFHAVRPHVYGLETHLVNMYQLTEEFNPDLVIVDPVSNLVTNGNTLDVKMLLTRLIDFLKTRQITTLFTNLNTGGESIQETEVGISSLMDTWILLRQLENGGERNRVLNITKSRGMHHSNQLREFILTDQGIDLVHAYIGSGEVLVGAARLRQETLEAEQLLLRQEDITNKKREHEHKYHALKHQIDALEFEIQSEAIKQQQLDEMENKLTDSHSRYTSVISKLRGSD